MAARSINTLWVFVTSDTMGTKRWGPATAGTTKR
jgi:hypothetical protein